MNQRNWDISTQKSALDFRRGRLGLVIQWVYWKFAFKLRPLVEPTVKFSTLLVLAGELG